MAGMRCFFCSEYNRLLDYDGGREEVNPKLHHSYGALILQLSWNDIAGRHHWSEQTIRPRPEGFQLRFCPECGRRLDSCLPL